MLILHPAFEDWILKLSFVCGFYDIQRKRVEMCPLFRTAVFWVCSDQNVNTAFC